MALISDDGKNKKKKFVLAENHFSKSKLERHKPFVFTIDQLVDGF
jgi:hypothetical protein